MSTVERELRTDSDELDAVERGAPGRFRVWTTRRTTVVVGRSVVVEEEVDVAACRAREIPVVRRPSGGRSVVVGRGTVQYSFVLPYSLANELGSITGSKRFCNRYLLAALDESPDEIAEDESGDLRIGDRKFGGLALKRRRNALLLHGTLLAEADLETIAAVLRHPVSEPAYRRGRAHREFLANFGPLDVRRFEEKVRKRLFGAG